MCPQRGVLKVFLVRSCALVEAAARRASLTRGVPHAQENAIRDAATFAEHARRKTITALDVVLALKRQNRTLYGAPPPAKARSDAAQEPSALSCSWQALAADAPPL